MTRRGLKSAPDAPRQGFSGFPAGGLDRVVLAGLALALNIARPRALLLTVPCAFAVAGLVIARTTGGA